MRTIVRSIRSITIAVFAIIAVQCSGSRDAASGTSTGDADPALPTVYPDHIILTVTEDPASSVAVTWRTSTAVGSGRAELAVAGHGPGFPETAVSFDAATETFTETGVPVNFHTLVFNGLDPGETYVYRVGDGKRWSEWIQFRMPEADGPFSFIYFGDAQNDIKSMWSRVVREAYSQLPRAGFMLHAGDLVNRYSSDAEWDEWFEAGAFIHAMIPALMTPGNHEYRSGNLSPQWRPQFNLPLNGPEGLEETCYWFDYKDMRVISLNSMTALRQSGSVETQAEWLQGVLESNHRKWTAVTLHHPLYATKAGRDNDVLREHFQPLFEKYDVDLVLQGHDHAYGRGHNVPMGASMVDGNAQTVYVVSVSGPKMYDLEPQDWMERKAKDTQLFQLISVDGDTIRYEAYTARGVLYDAFSIIKDDSGKRVVNDIPDIPERLD